MKGKEQGRGIQNTRQGTRWDEKKRPRKWENDKGPVRGTRLED